ncbi:DUF3899 domain-containing protein [Enterococcus columbae]|uniref:DUF3899 domain-containing protein n=1 Tax=Enterococcus columbae DSM 7374 = ATCC 51263 TaxID=1121865 RepID=S1NE14_9ENTE|nr:DUF3899 domain-containing protein [Enterococcus columbae]EOT39873.1 hypothetical protein OMW_01662 [Enterococcus columbae DSM 7374 = ATCC 51263]EOW83858.1 hypothetical protein I568_01305 [Enterococcus columbae DSM 7374 = ATCC 51263]OJG25320.1 hypothetical protein RR47_GL001765 [Enterococcus columbae DSM 7374 = ATCC 51263]
MRLNQKSLLIFLGLLIANILYLVIKQEFSIIHLSDTLFLTMLPLLIIGGFLFVFASGSFDLFHRSMKKAFHRSKEDDQQLSEATKGTSQQFLEPAILLFICSVVLLLIDRLL